MSGAVTQHMTAEAKAERTERWYKMRLAGMSVRDIAAAEGVSKSLVSKHCAEAAKSVTSAAVEEYRQTMDEQLDFAIQGLLPDVAQGRPSAVEAFIKLLDRRAKLWGLDQPTKIDVTQHVETEFDRNVRELTEEMARKNLPAHLVEKLYGADA